MQFTPSDLLSWLKANAAKYQVRFVRYDWPTRVGLSLTDLKCSIQIGGKTYSGFSCSPTEEGALVKSFSEALEHYVFDQAKVGFANGSAVHVTEELAIQKAVHEAIERHRFLESFYFTGFGHAETLEKDLPKQTLDLFEPFKKDWGIDFQFFCLSDQLDPKPTFVTLAWGQNCKQPFGLVIGLGDSTQSALECLRNVTGYLFSETPIRPLTLDQFRRMKNFEPIDHLRLSLDREYADQLKATGVFTLKLNPKVHPDQMVSPDATTSLPSPLAKKAGQSIIQDLGLPHHFAYVQSDDFIQIQFGIPSEVDAKANSRPRKKLHDLPHPIP